MNVALVKGRLTITIDSETETQALGSAIASVVKPGRVIGLVGDLGAGKTRLARAIAEALGVEPAMIASPTYVLIHEYVGVIPVFHFDAYRLVGPEEFDALGPSEYFDSGGVCLIEWADRVSDRLPADAWTIRITNTGVTSRSIVIEGADVSGVARALIS